MEEIRFAKTASRKVLGSLNDICFHYDAHVEHRYMGEALSLSEIELSLAAMPHSNLSLVFPDRTARALLLQESRRAMSHDAIDRLGRKYAKLIGLDRGGYAEASLVSKPHWGDDAVTVD